MKHQEVPAGTRAERVAWAKELYRQNVLANSRIRLRRSTRRIVVLALYAVVLMTSVWLLAAAANVISGGGAVAVLYALLTVQVLLFFALGYSVGQLDRPDVLLDERQRAQRDHANTVAYKILISFVAVASVAAIIATDLLHWLPSRNPQIGLTEFLAPIVWFVLTLPMSVMAWTLPDPEPEQLTE